MQEIYIKLGIVAVCSFIGVWWMNRVQNEKIRRARIEFEQMMKARGLSLDIEDKEKK